MIAAPLTRLGDVFAGRAGYAATARTSAASTPRCRKLSAVGFSHVQVHPGLLDRRAEARAVREHAAFQQAASEPHISIEYVGTGSVWSNSLRELVQPFGHVMAAGQSALIDKAIPAQTPSPATLRIAFPDREE